MILISSNNKNTAYSEMISYVSSKYKVYIIYHRVPAEHVCICSVPHNKFHLRFRATRDGEGTRNLIFSRGCSISEILFQRRL
jgi:hypothetical protein